MVCTFQRTIKQFHKELSDTTGSLQEKKANIPNQSIAVEKLFTHFFRFGIIFRNELQSKWYKSAGAVCCNKCWTSKSIVYVIGTNIFGGSMQYFVIEYLATRLWENCHRSESRFFENHFKFFF